MHAPGMQIRIWSSIFDPHGPLPWSSGSLGTNLTREGIVYRWDDAIDATSKNMSSKVLISKYT